MMELANKALKHLLEISQEFKGNHDYTEERNGIYKKVPTGATRDKEYNI